MQKTRGFAIFGKCVFHQWPTRWLKKANGSNLVPVDTMGTLIFFHVEVERVCNRACISNSRKFPGHQNLCVCFTYFRPWYRWITVARKLLECNQERCVIYSRRATREKGSFHDSSFLIFKFSVCSMEEYEETLTKSPFLCLDAVYITTLLRTGYGFRDSQYLQVTLYTPSYHKPNDTPQLMAMFFFVKHEYISTKG